MLTFTLLNFEVSLKHCCFYIKASSNVKQYFIVKKVYFYFFNLPKQNSKFIFCILVSNMYNIWCNSQVRKKIKTSQYMQRLGDTFLSNLPRKVTI